MGERLRIAARLVLIVGLTGASHAWGQNATEPFAAYEQELAKKADALLDSTTTARENTIQVEAPKPSAIGANDSSVPGLNSAAARVAFLRPALEPILSNHGIPADVAAAVMLVESGGRVDALSPKGARGLWQLMPETARRYGLRVDDAQDERLNVFKATDAAARYLRDLYARFGDWKLALAAYNAGENNVSGAMARAHSQSFERLASLGALPQETRDYVPRVLAATGVLPGAKAQARAGATVFAFSFQ